MIETATTGSAATETEDDRAVAAVLEEMYAAWTARDAARANALLGADERIVLWGTDQWEKIFGQAEVDLSPWIVTCPPWRSIRPTRRAIVVRDDLAYVADDAEGVWEDAGGRHTAHYRCTCVLQREDGVWRLIHTHFSAPAA